MKELIKLKNKYLKKIRKGAALCIRKKYLYIFENEDMLYEISFSLHEYKKMGKYETLQLEASIEGEGEIIASLQSKTGKANLKNLYTLLIDFKNIKKAIEVMKDVPTFEKNLKNIKFKKINKK